MKRILLLLALLITLAAPAGANTFKTTMNRNGVLEVTPPFRSFDNNRVGDCQYASAADLVLAEWPTAKITTSSVLNAYRTYGIDWHATAPSNPDQTTAPLGLFAGQLYLLDHGFGDHRASSITLIAGYIPTAPINRGAIVHAANHGGVFIAWNVQTTPTGHMFAMVHATATHVTLVSDGYVFNYTWSWFLWSYHQNGGQMTYYAVTWPVSSPSALGAK